MHTYKIKIKKVSGRLNESVLPSKNLLIKSKKSLSEKAILKEANAYFKKKYGLTVESLEVWDNDDLETLRGILEDAYQKWAGSSSEGRKNKRTLFLIMNEITDLYSQFKESKYSNRMHRSGDDIDYDNQYEIGEYRDGGLSHLENDIYDEIRWVANAIPRKLKLRGVNYNFFWMERVDLDEVHIDKTLKQIFYALRNEISKQLDYIIDETL